MPRPSGVNLHRIFGPNDPPDAWEQRVDYHMFFVHGLAKSLAAVGLRPNRKLFLPLRDAVARETQEWQRALLAATWSGFRSIGQINRIVEVRNSTFTTAASGVLAVELLLKDRGYQGDIYDEELCYVVAQDSFITQLTHEVWTTVRRHFEEQERSPWVHYLARRLGQPYEVFDQLVSGRLVTRYLADELLRIIQRFLPDFQGTVSNDFSVRRRMLLALRQDAYESAGDQTRYHRKITGASAEIYIG
jgi:hypothetical protein